MKSFLIVIVLLTILVAGCTENKRSNDTVENYTQNCEPGKYRCNGKDVEFCISDGSNWYYVKTCSPMEICISGSCHDVNSLKECSDGTNYSQCSSTKPKYCDNGNLIDNCDACGCPSEKSCNSTSGDCNFRPSVSLMVLPSVADIYAYPYFVGPYLLNFSVANIGNIDISASFRILHGEKNNDIYPLVTLNRTNATISPIGNNSELNESELSEAILTKGTNITASISMPVNITKVTYYEGYFVVQYENNTIKVPIVFTIHQLLEYVSLTFKTSGNQTTSCSGNYITAYIENSGTKSSGQINVNVTDQNGYPVGNCNITSIDAGSTGACFILKGSLAGVFNLQASNGNVGSSTQIYCYS